jgi:hypothetical protein
VGRTLVANSLLACSACGERRRGRPLNSVVRRHPNSLAMKYIVATFIICASIGAAAQDRGCGKRPVITTKLEDGTSIGVLVSEAQHKKAPAWSPGRGEPPISIARVADIAEKWAKVKYRDYDSVKIQSINLSEYGCYGEPKYWHYIVHFIPVKNGQPQFGGYFAVVLLDGTLIEPTRVKDAF